MMWKQMRMAALSLGALLAGTAAMALVLVGSCLFCAGAAGSWGDILLGLVGLAACYMGAMAVAWIGETLRLAAAGVWLRMKMEEERTKRAAQPEDKSVELARRAGLVERSGIGTPV